MAKPVFFQVHPCTESKPRYQRFSDSEIIVEDVSPHITGGNPPGNTTYTIVNPMAIDFLCDKVRGYCNAGINMFFVESNSAHMFSAIIANTVFDETDLNPDNTLKQKLVINLDQHGDYELGQRLGWTKKSTTATYMNCGNWGCFLDNGISYFVAGVEQASKPRNSSSERLIPNLTDIVADYNSYNSDNSIIYLSVDMDVINNGTARAQRTNWGANIYRLENLLSTISAIPDGTVIAADITGFPPYTDANADTVGYLEDLRAVASAVSRKLIR